MSSITRFSCKMSESNSNLGFLKLVGSATQDLLYINGYCDTQKGCYQTWNWKWSEWQSQLIVAWS